MNNMPLVSIIVPCYNHENYVQECIQSIIEQGYQNIELIIIDDGSKDNSVQKIKEMQELCRNRFARFEFRHRPNKGLSATLNEALEWCQGKYVSMIASDDIMLPNKTSVQASYLEKHPKITSLSSNVQYIDNNGKNYATSKLPQEEHDFNRLILKCDLFAPSQMHRLKILKELGGYNESLYIEDWSMWLKLAENGHKIMFLSEPLVQYRKHDSNMSNNHFKMIEAERQILDLYSNHALYKKSIYLLNRKSIKYYRDNGQKLKYYLLKLKIIFFKYILK